MSLAQLLGDQEINSPKQKLAEVKEPLKTEKIPVLVSEQEFTESKVTLQPERTPELPEKEKQFKEDLTRGASAKTYANLSIPILQ